MQAAARAQALSPLGFLFPATADLTQVHAFGLHQDEFYRVQVTMRQCLTNRSRQQTQRANLDLPRHIIRTLLSACLLGCLLPAATAMGQATLHTKTHAKHKYSQKPAAQPAVVPAPALPPPPTPSQMPPGRAKVTYSADRLEVAADNSSLNQILRQISQVTGTKLTGSVIDDRVYGTYGPASISAVLTSLLSGSGSNMLLVQGDSHTPSELILTPRTGGPTPPSPPSPEDDTAQPGVAAPPVPAFQPQPIQQTPQVPGASTNPNQPAAPNGTKTPQQIYDQLQRMRQQQQQQTPPQ